MPDINGLPAASTIDPVNDLLYIYTSGLNATQTISRNVYLGLSSAPVGLTDSQTLTNKVLTSPTISGPTLSGTIAGTYTIGGTPTFPASVTTLTGSQTLTNKVLTSPTINAPTITNATITADALTGYTTSNTGTLLGISVTTGVITTTNSVGAGANVTNGVQAAALATNAITLGYTQITGNFSTSSASSVQVTGLTATVTIPAGGRKVKITAYITEVTNTVGVTTPKITIWDGTVGSGTQLAQGDGGTLSAANYFTGMVAIAVVTPAVGSKTYNVGILSSASNSITIDNTATAPSFILVEAI